MVVSVFVTTGCGGFSTGHVSVDHHAGWGSPDTWEARGSGVSVFYYRGNCWEAEKVLINLAKEANSGGFDWKNMADPIYRDKKLKDECKRIGSE